MSEHDDLADRREAEVDDLERQAERNEERAQDARDKLERAQGDEFTPAAMGEDDPGRREDGEED